MDYVTVDALRVRGIHGCHKYERTDPQEFLVSVKVGADLSNPAASDALEDAIDFDFIRGAVEEAFARERRYLIETIAEEIARAVLLDARALEVSVSVRKPEVWKGNGMPGVEITRPRR
jgi:FolB domain-containing protein